MVQLRWRVVLVSLPLLAACASRADDPGEPMEAVANPIVGGRTDHGHPAVALLYEEPGYICSGTMIDKRVYLTAAHCLESANPADYTVIGATNVTDFNSQPDYQLQVDSVQINPAYDAANNTNDIGIVITTQDAPVAPYRWLAGNDGTYDIGTDFTAIGFGDAGIGGNTSGVKRRVDLDISQVFTEVYLYGTANHGVCFGDSGGPDIVVKGGMYTVIGVHSFVTSSNCDDLGGSNRTDDNASFIDGFASPDAGTAKASGGNGGGNDPLACSVASLEGRSPLAAAVMALVAFAVARKRR